MNGRHWFEVQANNLFIFTEIFLLLSWDAWKNRILTRTRINSSLSVRCSLSLFRWNSSDSNFCLFGGRTPRGGAVPRRQLLNRLAGGDVSLLFIHSLGSFLWMTFVNESYVTPSSDWHSIPSNSNDLKLIKLRRCFYLQWRNIAHKFRKECSWSNKLFNRITIACCPPPPLVVGEIVGGGEEGRRKRLSSLRFPWKWSVAIQIKMSDDCPTPAAAIASAFKWPIVSILVTKCLLTALCVSLIVASVVTLGHKNLNSMDNSNGIWFVNISFDSSSTALFKFFWVKSYVMKRQIKLNEEECTLPRSNFVNLRLNATSNHLQSKSKVVELFKSYRLV